MNSLQLKLFIRHAFALERYGENAVKLANPELRNAMLQVQQIVRARLPEESLLRDKALREMLPQVAEVMKPYNRKFAEDLVGQMSEHTPEIEKAAVEMIERAAPVAPPRVGAGDVARSVETALNSKVNNTTIKKLFNVDGQDPMSVWTKSNLGTIQSEVRKGIIDGSTTKQIADAIAPNADRRIRSQARAVARTAVQDYNRQVHEQVWDANAEALEGLEYEWVAALDSRTCPTCAPLDGVQHPKRGDFPLSTPAHVNCRCRLVLTDPEDEDDIRNGIQLSPVVPGEKKPPSSDYYATKVKVKGKEFWRKSVTTKGNAYADYLAGSDRVTQVQFFGGGELGRSRAQWFDEAVKKKIPPERALQKMLVGPTDARGFVVNKPTFTAARRKVAKKVAPKPKVVAKPASPKQAQSTPPAGPQGVDLTAARAKLRAKKAAQAQAEQAALKAATNKASGKAQAAKLQAEKNAAFKAKDLKKEAEIKSLKEGDDVTFAVGGVYGKGKVVTKPDLFDPKLPMQIKADADGPGWKKGDLIPANKNSKFISKGDPPKVAGLDVSKLSDAEKASKAKFDAFMAEKAKASAQAAIKKATVKLQPPAPVTVAPKPAVDIAKSFDDSKNSLGRGLFGEARLVDSGVTKRGWLSKNELDALEALKDTGVTPKPLGVSFVDKEWNTTLYKGMKVRKGYLAMDKAPGETIGKILDFGGGFTERQSREVTDSLLRARKKFHLKGVAHQDMHGNNVLYDLKSKQMTIIDLGTARIDARSALVEALGTNRGRMSFGQVEAPGDYQSRPTFTLLNKTSKLADNPVWKRFNANRRAVEAKLKREGAGSILNASIRKLPRDVTKNLSPARALELLEELYEGI